MAYPSVAGQQIRRITALAAVLVVAALAPAPALAAGPVRLSAASVSPSGGTTATTFTFRVTYTSRAGAAPRSVRVVISGVSRTMSPSVPSDRNYKDGAVFRLSTTLTARTHRYDFWATDSRGRIGALPGGWIRVTGTTTAGSGTVAPTPRPSTGGSTAKPAPTPQPLTDAPPASGSTSSGSGSNGSSSPRSGSTSSGAGGSAAGSGGKAAQATQATGTGSAAAGALGVVAGSRGLSLVIVPSLASPDAAVTGAAAGRAVVDYAAMRPAGPVGAPRPRLGLDFLSASLPGYGTGAWTQAMTQTLVVSTSTSVTFAFALLFFARRRRDQQDAAVRDQEENAKPLDDVALAAYLYGPQRAAAMAAELSLPRWRRPSVQAARLAPRDRPAQQMAHERLTFDQGTLAMADGREFRKIRYRMVRLSDRPDEILGYELARLDEGDEVEILERSGSYVQVRTPYGLEGWVHRTTVGATVQPIDRALDAPPERDFTYVGPDESLVVRLIRERSAASG